MGQTFLKSVFCWNRACCIHDMASFKRGNLFGVQIGVVANINTQRRQLAFVPDDQIADLRAARLQARKAKLPPNSGPASTNVT